MHCSFYTQDEKVWIKILLLLCNKQEKKENNNSPKREKREKWRLVSFEGGNLRYMHKRVMLSK